MSDNPVQVIVAAFKFTRTLQGKLMDDLKQGKKSWPDWH